MVELVALRRAGRIPPITTSGRGSSLSICSGLDALGRPLWRALAWKDAEQLIEELSPARKPPQSEGLPGAAKGRKQG